MSFVLILDVGPPTEWTYHTGSKANMELSVHLGQLNSTAFEICFYLKIQLFVSLPCFLRLKVFMKSSSESFSMKCAFCWKHIN